MSNKKHCMSKAHSKVNIWFTKDKASLDYRAP
jgi:hypothetical protein